LATSSIRKSFINQKTHLVTVDRLLARKKTMKAKGPAAFLFNETSFITKGIASAAKETLFAATKVAL
jgi:hypothetical protein